MRGVVAARDMSDEEQQAKRELQEYLDAHALEKTLNQLVNTLARKRPSEPFYWLAQQLDGC
eukprot:3542787-Pleurochrysis_carterae.AAC.1